MGGQGGCDRRIEKFLGNFRGGGRFSGGEGGVDVNEELKFLCKLKKKKKLGGLGGGGPWGSMGGPGWGVRVDENEELKFL